MPTLRTLTPDQYARVSNDAVDHLASVLAIGYLTVLMRHEDGWVPSVEKLVKKYLEGEASLGKARKTLRDEGYYVRVTFQYDGGKHHTDIWRASEPHTEVELDEIASYYAAGSIWQIPQTDKSGKHVRDARSRTVMRPVTVRSAQMESWRSTKERITGTLVDNSSGDDVSPGRTGPGNSGGRMEDGESPGHSNADDVSPGRTGPRVTGPRVTDHPVSGGSKRRRGEKTNEEDEENSPSPWYGESPHAGETEQGQGETPPGNTNNDDGDRSRVAHFLSKVIGSIPPDSAATVTTSEKHQLVDLVLDAEKHGVEHGSISGELANVHGTTYVGQAWLSKIRRLIDGTTQKRTGGKPPRCGQCEARYDSDPLSARVTQRDGRDVWCPRCHPKGTPEPTQLHADADTTHPGASQTA